jgi:hypothetical protein
MIVRGERAGHDALRGHGKEPVANPLGRGIRVVLEIERRGAGSVRTGHRRAADRARRGGRRVPRGGDP